MRQGKSSYEAMRESIILRTRPVLMTAISVSVGMIPVAFGWAIGLERLAPLGAVVLGGLLVGTLLTLIFIPLFFVWLIQNELKKMY
jgi:multidrug efflux pump subunit AcrB